MDTTFDALGLPGALLSALEALGYEEPTPIQREAIPPLLAGKDVLGQAATGTGKTAAFALPLLARLKPGSSKMFEAQALVLVPTRELALQVTEAIGKYGKAMGVSVVAVYGGEEIVKQLRPLKRGVDVVVATPGRAIDHLKRKSLLLGKVATVVLDEADEMLDMGFAEDLEILLEALPEGRQTALFSATMPPRILKIAEKHLRSPVRVSIARHVAQPGEAPRVKQTAYVVPRKFKTLALLRIFQAERPQSALVFCRTRAEVDELSSVLVQQGEPAAALHGGLTQEQRDKVMRTFKSGAVKYLVATDVAARGLHIESLSHVVNYDVPSSPEVYVHRTGRTGRAGREGIAITLVEPAETRWLQGLERAAGAKIGIGKVPTPAELKGQQIDRTRAAVAAAVEAKKGNELRALVDGLGPDPVGIAAAAIALLHEASGTAGQASDMIQIPSWTPQAGGAKAFDKRRPERHERPPPQRHEAVDRAPPARPSARVPAARPSARAPVARPSAAGKRSGPPKRAETPRFVPPEGGVRAKVTVWISAGQLAGIRPQDLVGAIANEAKLDSKQIGPIQIREKFSLVGIPAEAVDRVIEAMTNSALRGRKVQVRRER